MNGEAGQAIEHYFFQLRILLLKGRVAERDEIVRELRSHVAEEFADERGTAEEVYDRLARVFGSPEEIARAYKTEGLLASASRSWSPWRLLRGAASWAFTGVSGFFVFLFAMVGYGTALCFFVCAILKPIFPDDVGFWVYQGGMNFGMPVPRPPLAHEVLGVYFIPVSIVLSFVVAFLTMQGLRWMMRRYGQVKRWAAVAIPAR
jgi:uncharacterized membrane protein